MARTSKSRGASPFTMKSGNKTTFKIMGSSPMRVTGTPETYDAAIDAVTADMSDEELRDIALEQHKTGTRGWDVSLKTLQKKRRSLRPTESTKEVKKPVEIKKETTTTSDSDELTGYTISNEDQEAIFQKYGGGVLKGDALEARNKDLRDAAARYGR